MVFFNYLTHKFHTMKRFLFLLLVFAGMLIYTACEKTGIGPIEETPEYTQEYTVPEIPPEIAALMRPEDIARFKAGPGDEYLNAVRARSLFGHSQGPARWHPIMMHIGYDLQFVPIAGINCEPGNFHVCIPGTCMDEPIGLIGETQGLGKWLGSDIYAHYTPIFCGITGWDGYGEGVYESIDDRLEGEHILVFSALHDPSYYDDEGNLIFYRHADFAAGSSTGIFEGAFGWETAIIVTTPENNPENDPYGQGYSEAVHFGWVFF